MIRNRQGGKKKPSELIADLILMEKEDPQMYYFCMQILLENLLLQLKEMIKNANKS